MLKVIRTTTDDPDYWTLVKFLDKELNERYGSTKTAHDSHILIEFMKTAVVAYSGREPIACGCFKSYEKGTVEIKRMFVKPENRGSGIATMVLTELEKFAAEKKFQKCILETGIKQPEAIAFYMKSGYERTENYGPYLNRSDSVCFSKALD